MNVIRVGEGRSSSGKILDKDTKWFVWNTWQDGREDAIKYAQETHRKIYLSRSNEVYREVTINELRNLKLYSKIIIGT